MDFIEFQKIPRLSRDVIITEKIDGTNAQIYITDEGDFHVGSRTRWLTPEADNHGFCKWALEHKDELLTLGPGRHFGEWWGGKIQRGYGITEKRFSLFNVSRWWTSHPGESFSRDDAKAQRAPECCHVVPVIADGIFTTDLIESALGLLATRGSYAAYGFYRPEGVVIYHVAGNLFFKKTFDKDEMPKSAGLL